MNQRKPHSAGFTLIEMLTVIAIILFLLAMMSGVFLRTTKAAKVKAANALLQKVGIALARYQAELRALPPDSGYGLPQNGGIVSGQVLYDATTLWKYLGRELTFNGQTYGPFTQFNENELVACTDASGTNAFMVVDPWKNPIGYVGEPKRVIHNRDTFDLFSAGPDGKTACNDGIDNDGDGATDNANTAYIGSGAASSREMGEAAFNGSLTGFKKNPKAGEILDDINNWDPQY
jgi:prepilin-type N-terminal cleavage/methylation domain-containing protein